jgi:(1->4)-alpha-D-glucan 1-alpha-D-glucosylmutase
MRVPSSTYRVQANWALPLTSVAELVRYLRSLGASDVYCSPILKARSRSVHCYDVVDYSRINPELGGEAGLRALSATLSAAGMGLLVDIVPNHMSASSENPYWMDVLEYGRSSRYADLFDIDWDPPAHELSGKVLLPILDGTLRSSVASGAVRLVADVGPSPLALAAGDEELPLSPRTYPRLLSRLAAEGRASRQKSSAEFANSLLESLQSVNDSGNTEEFGRVKRLLRGRVRNDPRFRSLANRCLGKSATLLRWVLRQQHYVLGHWRDADTMINYRRFINVNGLVAVKVEDKQVFMETHSIILGLLREGKVGGVRVDHADGLRDPALYFSRLNAESKRGRTGSAYVLAEKILQSGRKLPGEWEVSGTTGYGFMNDLNRLFVRRESERRLSSIYRRFSGEIGGFERAVHEGKLLAMLTMRAERKKLALLLNRRDPEAPPARATEEAVGSVAARFEGYRLYISPRTRSVNGAWRTRILDAVRAAGRDGSDPRALKSIEAALMLEGRRSLPPARARDLLEFVLRFQQLTAAVAVKGEEDTALYRYNRLVSLNEVGGDPRLFGCAPSEFHRRNLERLQSWPHAMVSTSTHDTKRSEDVRARVNVISEMPGEWEASILRWRRLLLGGKRERRVPSGNDEYLFYQTLLGAWPHAPELEYEAFVERMVAYMRKATKEERRETSWERPNARYDSGLERFVRRSLKRSGRNRFLADFARLETRVDWFGMLNSLSQTLIRLTAPGVPDTYQGNELWDYSLVDPDNRRPVDFEARRSMLSRIDARLESGGPGAAADLVLEDLRSGMAKMYVTCSVLRFRRLHATLFSEGSYSPLWGRGERRRSVVGFSRRIGGAECAVIAPTHFTELCGPGRLPLGPRVWGKTEIALGVRPAARYANVFTGEEVTPSRRGRRSVLLASELFSKFPVALLDPV